MFWCTDRISVVAMRTWCFSAPLTLLSAERSRTGASLVAPGIAEWLKLLYDGDFISVLLPKSAGSSR